MAKGKFQDLTGMKFGRLIVIKREENHITPSGQMQTMWLCKCDCGNEVIINGQSLKNGVSQSCGCFKKEFNKGTKKKYNTYDLSGEYGIGYTLQGEEFYFDLEDYNKIKDYCWWKDSFGYLQTHLDQHSTIRMHRLIMDCFNKNIEVDHKHHILYDNRKKFLRLVNKSKNGMNKSLLPNNTSGTTGVCWSNKAEKWIAYIGLNNKSIYLGAYDNIKDAINIRKEAEKKYFKEYSYSASTKDKK